MSDFSPQNDEIAKLAYQYWEDGGRDHGHDQEHWLKAEATLSGRHGNSQREADRVAPYAPDAERGERFPSRYSMH